MNEIIRTGIVDDHHIFRTGLKYILDSMPDVKVLFEASSGRQLLELLNQQKVDLIFMDIKLPDTSGIELVRKLRKSHPGIKIIALTMYSEIEYFNKMIDAGAKGFLLKKADSKELTDAIKSVMNDHYHVAQEFSAYLKYTGLNPVQNNISLTKREKEILGYICEGYSTQEIADKLFLSIHTIEGHRKNIISKTGAKNTANLVKFTITNGLLQP